MLRSRQNLFQITTLLILPQSVIAARNRFLSQIYITIVPSAVLGTSTYVCIVTGQVKAVTIGLDSALEHTIAGIAMHPRKAGPLATNGHTY